MDCAFDCKLPCKGFQGRAGLHLPSRLEAVQEIERRRAIPVSNSLEILKYLHVTLVFKICYKVLINPFSN